MALQSQLFRGDPKLEAAAVSPPAHILPGATGDHVRKIQQALNELDSAALAVDGIYGKATANAVLRYKQTRDIVNRSYQTAADDIVGVMTMAALDREMAALEGDDGGTVPVTSRSFGACDVQEKGKGAKGKSNIQPADPVTAALASSLLVELRTVIRETRFQLDTASVFVQTNKKLAPPTGLFSSQPRRCINALIQIFSMDKFANPRPGYENIRRVFKNMDVALNRTFETAPSIAPELFVANTRKSMETSLAYTATGGAFRSSKEKIAGLGVPADRIYVCNTLVKQNVLEQVDTLLHELAHFVSGQPLVISHEHGVPKKGDMLVDRAPLDKIEPEAKLRSAEHYAFFAMTLGGKQAFPNLFNH